MLVEDFQRLLGEIEVKCRIVTTLAAQSEMLNKDIHIIRESLVTKSLQYKDEMKIDDMVQPTIDTLYHATLRLEHLLDMIDEGVEGLVFTCGSLKSFYEDLKKKGIAR